MNNILEFKNIEISDRPWADSLLSLSDYRATEYCFTSLYMWAPFYGTMIARYKDWLLIRSDGGEFASYIFPAGKGDMAEILEIMEEDAARIGKKFALFAIEGVREKIDQAFPGRYEFVPVRNSFDYIYDTQSMIALSGRKYQPKRNFISRFKTQQPDWKYESIRSDNPGVCAAQIAECVEMTDEWCAVNGCSHNESMHKESCAVRKVLRDFVALGLSGGLLRAGGRVVAYTIGERLNSDTFIVHVEKAFSDVTGAYPMINQAFLASEASGLKYVNREDDAGDEGLRKAKLSYHPAFMLEKYLAVRG